MQLPDRAVHRLTEDHVVWLTTVTDSGAPAPNPVWCALDGDEIVVFTSPTSRRVHNLEQRPAVSLHFNTDHLGGDVVVINGTAKVVRPSKPSRLASYVAKYEQAMAELHDLTLEQFDATFDTEIRIRPERARAA
jgi:PPOX class probable F420-dependent enzyme